MKTGNEWKIGDVLFLTGGGCCPSLFIAEALPGSYTNISGGCYSPDDYRTRKATVEDADRRVEYQLQTVMRETAEFMRLFELRKEIIEQAKGQ